MASIGSKSSYEATQQMLTSQFAQDAADAAGPVDPTSGQPVAKNSKAKAPKGAANEAGVATQASASAPSLGKAAVSTGSSATPSDPTAASGASGSEPASSDDASLHDVSQLAANVSQETADAGVNTATKQLQIVWSKVAEARKPRAR